MNEDFVTYYQAVKLKELGFDWKVRACYRRKLILDDNPHYTEPKFIHNDTMGKRWTTNYNDNRCGGGSGKYYYSAPTLAQAQKWLREEKKLIICIGHGSSIPAMYYWYINKSDGTIIDGDIESKDYDTYEQALSAGIDKALELLKEKK